jgi:hypothetical protein
MAEEPLLLVGASALVSREQETAAGTEHPMDLGQSPAQLRSGKVDE